MPQTNNRVQKYVTVGGPLTDSRILDDGTNIEMGPTFTPIEATTWANSTVRAGRTLSGSNNNECVVNVQTDVGSTGSNVSYEKPALFVVIRTEDESNAPSLGLDAVAAHFSGNIKAGNSQGRVWGALCAAVMESGDNTDGAMTGIEVDVFNEATTDAPDLGTPFNKTGISTVAYGTQNSTNAIAVLAGSNGKWHRGLVGFDSSFVASTGNFIELVEEAQGIRSLRLRPLAM